MIVVYVYADNPREWNCSNYNCVIPSRAINRTEEHEAYLIYLPEFVSNQPHIEALCNRADLIIVERNLFGDTLTMMQYWKVRGKNIVTVFDDAYDLIHPENTSHDFWTKGKMEQEFPDGKVEDAYMNPTPLAQLKWGLQMVKAGHMPSVNLCKDWGKYTKTHYIRNCIELSEYQDTKILYPHDAKEIYIGWCGSLSHFASFLDSGILVAIENICNKYENVKFLVSGDERIYKALPIDEGRKIFQTFVPKEDWSRLLRSLDIGLAPLVGEYDMRRSWIKVLEYMLLQIPWVATKCITYDDFTGFGNLVENTAEGWESGIEDAIQNLESKREFAKGIPYEFAIAQNSDQTLPERLAIYQEIIDSEYPERIANGI